MQSERLALLARLLGQRSAIDAQISTLINRPSLHGHIGEGDERHER